jgi:quinol monooxygenase YgiN
MIHVIATIELNAGKRDAFLKEFHELMPKVRAEVGCIEYGPTADVETGLPVQVPFRENVITIIEKWSDLPALKAHLGASHMLEYRQRVQGLVSQVKLQVLQPV